MTSKTNLSLPSLLLLLLALLLPSGVACAASQDTVQAAGTVTINGDCRILTDPNGHKFALVGKLEAANGDMIRVTGKKTAQTKCLKGPAIRVEKIEKVHPNQEQQAAEPGKPVLKFIQASPDQAGSIYNTTPKEGEIRRLRMVGTLNDDLKAQKCQGFLNFRGELWALTGDLKTFKSGDKVELEGIQVSPTPCGKPTLQVTFIEAFKG